MKNENVKTVSEMEAEKISTWADEFADTTKDDWKTVALLAYKGPGTYEGEVSVETEDDDYYTAGFEIVSRQYSLRDFLHLLENVSIMHDGTEYKLRDGVTIKHLTFRTPLKGAASVDLKDLDGIMEDLHWALGVSYNEYENWYNEDAAKFHEENPDSLFIWDEPTDYATAVNIQDGKVTGVIMDGRDRTKEAFVMSPLQKLYDYLDEQFAPLIYDEGAEHLDGLVITTCSSGHEKSDYEDNKGKNSRAVYDNEHNTVIVETGTFIYDDDENKELRQEMGEDYDDYDY